MRRFVVASIFAMFAAPAFAADLPLIAKSGLPLAYPYNGGSGFYAGVNVFGGVAQSSATSNSLFASSLASGNLTAAGGAVGGTVGYTRGNSNFWWALEASGDWQNVSAGTSSASAATPSATMASRWSAEEVVKIGGSLQFNFLNAINLLGINFPTFELPVAPSGISVAAAPHPYIMAGVKEFGISGTVGQAGGTTVGVAPLVGAGTISSILDGTGKPTGLALDLFAEVVFANKGLGFSNVFGTGGAPVNANLTMNNQYWAGAKVLF